MAYTNTLTRNSKARSGLALGGIGAGWLELRQDGCTYDWNIFNNRPLGTGSLFEWDESSMLFFIVRCEERGKDPVMRLLQIENKYGAGGIRSHEHYYIVPWLSGVDSVEYSATFPFTTLRFTDAKMPVIVEMEAFSPFIPHDTRNSSLPAAIFSFKATSKTANPVDVTIVASMRNAVAYDAPQRTYVSKLRNGKGFRAFEMTAANVDSDHFSQGTMGIASFSPSSSYYLGWEHHHPYYEILIRNRDFPNVNDTAGRNRKNPETGKMEAMDCCYSSIAHSCKLKKRNSTFDHTFAVTWCFPNNYGHAGGWEGVKKVQRKPRNDGHYYNNFFSTSTQVASYIHENLDSLTERTRRFNTSFYNSSLPLYVLDQVNSHLNTLITSSWYTKAGHFGILEGLNSYMSYAGLSTTDVAMYGSVPYAALFPELANDVMRCYANVQNKNGSIAHSIPKGSLIPGSHNDNPVRVDMPAQFAFMALRGFFWSSDMKYLREIWPAVKRAMAYILRERDKNGDSLPDMTGVMCSYDNFPMHGVAPYVAGQWLAAVAAMVEAAEALGEEKTAARYRHVLAAGSKNLEQTTWNGRYYRLYNNDAAKKGDRDEGCLTDQLIGLWALHQIGGHPYAPKGHTRRALRSVLEMNFKPDYGLRNCQWPGDSFLHDVDKDTWIDQANTVWTGVELAFASFLIYEGMVKEGLKVIKNVDDRYRHWGMYWDHQEFGGRYFRPLSAWAIINSFLGLTINNGTYGFAPKLKEKAITLFFAFCGGYATFGRTLTARGEKISIAVKSGTFTCTSLKFERTVAVGKGTSVRLAGRVVSPGNYTVSVDKKTTVLTFRKPLSAKVGSALVISLT